ncbi:MAG: hypothetical protein ACRCXN_07170 [Bacteroidales bacterium]
MEKTFKLRIEEFWSKFQLQEKELYQMILSQDDPEAIMDRIQELLNVAFESVYFELATSEDKCILNLRIEGNRLIWFLNDYWKRKAPSGLSERWIFNAALPMTNDNTPIDLDVYGKEINANDFDIHAETNRQEAKINLEIVAPKLKDSTDQEKYSTLYLFLEHYLGEIEVMEYIGDIEFTDKPAYPDKLKFPEFAAYIQGRIDEHKWLRVDKPTSNFSTYSMDPVEEDTLDLREDVIAGNSACIPIINAYYNDDPTLFRFAMENGVFLGFFYYNNTKITPDTSVAFRAEIEQKLEEKINGKGIADLIGGATGLEYSYIDIIVYDMDLFKPVAKEVLESYALDESGLSEFVRGGDIEL